MVDQDRAEFGVIMAGLASTFGREVDEALLTGYWMGLGDLEISEVKQGATRAMREAEFMPTVRQLRDLSGSGNADMQAALAFEHLRSAITSVGYYGSIAFDDPAITAAVRNLGGWSRVCEMEVEQFEKWFRPQFEKVYKGFRLTGVSEEQASPLLGHFDRENGFNGYEQRALTKYETGLPPTRVLPKPTQFKLRGPDDETQPAPPQDAVKGRQGPGKGRRVSKETNQKEAKEKR